MLDISATNDKQCLDKLSEAVFGAPFDGGVGFVLNVDDKPSGVAKLVINEDVARIVSVGVIKEERGKGYGDFFTRVLMDNLTRVSKTVVIGYVSDYYEKFGFRQCGGQMEIDSDKIVFPSTCGGHHS